MVNWTVFAIASFITLNSDLGLFNKFLTDKNLLRDICIDPRLISGILNESEFLNERLELNRDRLYIFPHFLSVFWAVYHELGHKYFRLTVSFI